jgi:hypothetical protein
MLLSKIYYMSIVQNPDAHCLLERVLGQLCPLPFGKGIRPIVPILLPIRIFWLHPIGQAQFPHRHITTHNGLYLAHSMIRNGFTALIGRSTLLLFFLKLEFLFLFLKLESYFVVV